MNNLSMHDFATLSISYLENNGSLSYADLPNIDTFHYTTSKHHICLLTLLIISLEKSVNTGKLSDLLW